MDSLAVALKASWTKTSSSLISAHIDKAILAWGACQRDKIRGAALVYAEIFRQGHEFARVRITVNPDLLAFGVAPKIIDIQAKGLEDCDFPVEKLKAKALGREWSAVCRVTGEAPSLSIQLDPPISVDYEVFSP
jgi:hypothetical protein